MFPDVSDSTSTNAEDTQVNNDQSDDFELKKTLAQLDDHIVYDGFVFGKDYENMGVSLLGARRYSDAKTINIPGSIIVDDKEQFINNAIDKFIDAIVNEKKLPKLIFPFYEWN